MCSSDYCCVLWCFIHSMGSSYEQHRASLSKIFSCSFISNTSVFVTGGSDGRLSAHELQPLPQEEDSCENGFDGVPGQEHMQVANKQCAWDAQCGPVYRTKALDVAGKTLVVRYGHDTRDRVSIIIVPGQLMLATSASHLYSPPPPAPKFRQILPQEATCRPDLASTGPYAPMVARQYASRAEDVHLCFWFCFSVCVRSAGQAY